MLWFAQRWGQAGGVPVPPAVSLSLTPALQPQGGREMGGWLPPAAVMPWAFLPRAKGSQEPPPPPASPCLPSRHGRGIRMRPVLHGKGGAGSISPGLHQATPAAPRQARSSGNSCLMQRHITALTVLILGMGDDTGCLISGFPARPAFWRCCKGGVFLTLRTKPRCFSFPKKRGKR